jgi:hypothetical protein
MAEARSISTASIGRIALCARSRMAILQLRSIPLRMNAVAAMMGALTRIT